MQLDPEIPSFKADARSDNAPPIPLSEPPVIGAPPPPITGPPPPTGKPTAGRQFLLIVLSLCLGLFLADAMISLVDDSLILFLGVHLLTTIRGIVFFFTVLMAVAVYGLMGFLPMIPKRLFLTVTLFNPVAGLFVIPLLIYFYSRIHQIAWGISIFQVVIGFSILYRAQGGLKFRWPLIPATRLQARRFSWRSLSVFLLVNVFVLLPAVLIYFFLCAHLATGHLSGGFVALRPGGVTVQARKYVRSDGKTIQLFPMAHIGDAAFYRKLSRSFPTNSIILMEGVTDDRNLLTNKITYKRAAESLGLAEQQEEFNPTQGEMVQADVDVDQFSASTIGLLNLVMLFHTKGVNPETALMLMQYSPPPHFEEQLFDDLLRKRNRHLLEEIDSRLLQSENIVVPWGAAHMPEIAQNIQKAGFRLEGVQEYMVIRFGSAGNKNTGRTKPGDSEKPK